MFPYIFAWAGWKVLVEKGQADVPPVRLSRGLLAYCGRPSQQLQGGVNGGLQLVHSEFGIRRVYQIEAV
jgi:hypothetical protein